MRAHKDEVEVARHRNGTRDSVVPKHVALLSHSLRVARHIFACLRERYDDERGRVDAGNSPLGGATNAAVDRRIERGADLSELATLGFQIDSVVSTPLLMQIFTPPGPTHDGAVIIQQGRISAAAVFLQLTHNAKIDNAIGTRHRAAMGATEEYDAVAVVVSEERGQISFVEGGNLTRDLDTAMLRKVLQQFLGAPPEEEGVARES